MRFLGDQNHIVLLLSSDDLFLIENRFCFQEPCLGHILRQSPITLSFNILKALMTDLSFTALLAKNPKRSLRVKTCILGIVLRVRNQFAS